MNTFVDPLIIKFIEDNNLNKRYTTAQNIINKYPNMIPIIIGRGELKTTPMITKFKYLVPRDSLMGNLVVQIRKQLSKDGLLHDKTGLFFFINNEKLIPNTSSMEELYNKYKSDDGFLYITYMRENTFGNF